MNAVGVGVRSVAAVGRRRVVAAMRDLFSHGDHPLADTLSYMGDPGLFGPGSMTWPVIGDASVFVGGIRALLVQAAHPEVAAGVADHSAYRTDPLGRLARTAAYVSATSFGAMPEVDRAVAVVRRRHGPVVGTSDRGLPYDAADPALDAWVHNSLTDSFLTAFQAYGVAACTDADADQFVDEQRRVGHLLGAEALPDTACALRAWIDCHPALAPSRGSVEAIRFLERPPLSLPVLFGYGILFRAAVAIVPERIREIIGVRTRPGELELGRTAVAALRWSLGSSPDWRLALKRSGAAVPPGADFRHSDPSQRRLANHPSE